MPGDEGAGGVLDGLLASKIDFIVVGATAAVMQGAPVVTFDLDIVHRRSLDNVERLLSWLLENGAYHRFDLANRKLPPTREALLGQGHINLATGVGDIDVLCELEPGQGFDEFQYPYSSSVFGWNPGDGVWGRKRRAHGKHGGWSTRRKLSQHP